MTSWILTVVFIVSGYDHATSQAMLYPDRSMCEAALAAHKEIKVPARVQVYGVCTETRTAYYR